MCRRLEAGDERDDIAADLSGATGVSRRRAHDFIDESVENAASKRTRVQP